MPVFVCILPEPESDTQLSTRADMPCSAGDATLQSAVVEPVNDAATESKVPSLAREEACGAASTHDTRPCDQAPASAELASLMEIAATGMLQALGLDAWELSLTLCDDAHMRIINQTHRHIDRSTDVLAFPLLESFVAPPLLAPDGVSPGLGPVPCLGDVVLSVPTAARQAAEQGRDLLSEMTFLLAHGLLHLLGQDHRDEGETRRMSARTDLLHHRALQCLARQP